MSRKITLDQEFQFLPISRSISAIDLLPILNQKKIPIKKCERLDKKILYFYYASFFYTVARGKDKLSEEDVLPVGVIFENYTDDMISEIFSTDTGHFLQLKKDKIEPKGYELSDLKIGQNLASLKQFIQEVWQSNEKYLDSVNILKNENKKGQFEKSHEYLVKKADFLNNRKFPSSQKFDNRVLRTEVHLNRDIDLDEKVTLVVPHRNLIQFKKELDEKNIKVKYLTYPLSDIMVLPEVKSNALNERLVSYIREKYEQL